jgi:hypothetical protein
MRPARRFLQALSCSVRLEWGFANWALSIVASVSQARADATSRKIRIGLSASTLELNFSASIVEFIGRRDYGDPAHQLVDFVAPDTGSDREEIVLA